MKRSEAIKIVADKLNGRQKPLDLQEEISEVLKEFELLGMLPPGYFKPIPFESDGKQYPLVPGDFKNKQEIWCTPEQHEWEPENET